MESVSSAEERIDFRIENQQLSFIGHTANYELLIEICITTLSLLLGCL